MLCGDVFLLIFRISGIAAADIQKGKRITHAAFGKTGNQGSGILINQDVFLLADIFDPFGDDLRINAAKIKSLAAGKDGCRDFVNLGGCENKDNMLGRFLHNFKQCIESTNTEHMGFVDDIDAVFGNSRSEVCFFAQLTDVVHTVVAGSVDFGDIQNGAVIDPFADFADTAGIAVLLVRAVYCFGNDFGAGCFAGSA